MKYDLVHCKRTGHGRQYFDLNVSGDGGPCRPPSPVVVHDEPLGHPSRVATLLELWPAWLVWQLNYCSQWTCFNGKLSSKEMKTNRIGNVAQPQPPGPARRQRI